MRSNGVAITVPSQKHHFMAADMAESQRAGRFAIGRAHHLPVRNLQIGQGGQPGTTNNCNHACSRFAVLNSRCTVA